MTGGMMFKGTPGPWRFEEYQDAISDTSVRVVGYNGDVVCDSEPYYAHALDPKNGPLIAAAPELLEALLMLQKQALQSELNSPNHEWGIEALAVARAAISKALGEQK